MKYKYLYCIVLTVTAILLVSPACGSNVIDEPVLGFDIQMTMTAVNENPQFETGSLDFEGYRRKYIVFLPENYPGNSSFPLVIYLHSYGSHPTFGMYYTLLYEVADSQDFLVVYPSAVENWNSGIGEDPVWPTPESNDVGFINALLDRLGKRYDIDTERVYAVGYSNGGSMAYKLACQLSDRIAAVASVAGVLPNGTAAECKPVRPIPVLHIHGTDDHVIYSNGGRYYLSVEQTLDYWIENNHCTKADTIPLQDSDPQDGSTVEKYRYTNCDNNSDVFYYKVINGGHSWPGAEYLDWAGNTNQDFDASSEIWNFFKDKQLPPTSGGN